MIEAFEQHGAKLQGIDSVKPDGRDPTLQLVRARLRAGDRDKQVVIGVRLLDGRWRVVRI